MKINDKLRKGKIVRYQPEKIWQNRYEQKLNENDQYATQSQENESRFHYLCLGGKVLLIMMLTFQFFNFVIDSLFCGESHFSEINF